MLSVCVECHTALKRAMEANLLRRLLRHNDTPTAGTCSLILLLPLCLLLLLLLLYTKVSPPSWADGIACPSLDGLDPIREAEMLLARAETCMRKGGPISTDVVNEVFALMQLAVNDRYFCSRDSPLTAARASNAPEDRRLLSMLRGCIAPRWQSELEF